MGFWSWLFGFGKGNEIVEEIQEIHHNVEISAKEPEQIVTRKPKYKPRVVSREDALFVQDMAKKASTPDTKITPFVDKTDTKYIEKVTNELKEKIARGR
ncbi:hypothetical protein HYV88_00075 [Candidatus Woesearchaeota archaeon]|nr:hypothetical protein [Candidatus Woesearchaeota archaeon]